MTPDAVIERVRTALRIDHTGHYQLPEPEDAEALVPGAGTHRAYRDEVCTCQSEAKDMLRDKLLREIRELRSQD